jgi:gas vesicle protein
MSENPFAKYGSQQSGSGNPFAKYGPPPGADEDIIEQYAQDIQRRLQGGAYDRAVASRLQDPATLRRMAEIEAERNGYQPPKQDDKMGRLATFATAYGQGGTFGFGEEISGAADFVGGTAMGLVRGEGLGAIESGKQAYSERVAKDRAVINKAKADNPYTYIAGELTGGVVTTAPLPVGLTGAGARTTAQVGLQASAKGDKLAKLAQASTGARQARLAAKSAALKAKAAKLALPAQNVGQAVSRAGGRVAEGVGKGAAYGAGYGGLYAAGTAEGGIPERLDEAAQGAAFGAAVGGVLSPAAQFVVAPIVGKAGYSLFTNAENKALDMILTRAERSGTSLQKVRDDFDRWQKSGEVPETLAELMGPNERSLLSAMITVNRESREQAANVFVNRGRGEVDRLEDAFARSFGARRGDYSKAQMEAARARVEDPEPLYAAAHYGKNKTLKPLDPQKQASLNNILADEDDVGRIIKDAAADLNRMGHKAARDEVRMYGQALEAARRGERVQIPNLSVQAADYIERAINQSYKAVGGGSGEISGSIAGWRALRNNVRAIIDDTGIGDARATAAEAIRRGELLEEGLDIMKPSVDVDDVNRIMQGIPDANIPAASDEGRRAYGVGAARAIANELRNAPNMGGFADATRKVARTPALRDKLEAARPKVLVTDPQILAIRARLAAGRKLTKKQQARVDKLGPQFAEKIGSVQTKANAALDEAIERASNRAQFGVDMVGNSKTAFRQGDVTDALADDGISAQIGQSVSDLLAGGPAMAASQVAQRFGRDIGRAISQPRILRPNINRAATDILLSTGDQIPAQVAKLAARAASRKMGRITSRGLPPPVGGVPPTAPSTPPRGTPPSGSPTLSPNALAPQGPIRAAGFGGGKDTTTYATAMREAFYDDAAYEAVMREIEAQNLSKTQLIEIYNAVIPFAKQFQASDTKAQILNAMRKNRILAVRAEEGPKSAGLPLRSDLGNALAGAGLGAAGPADSNEERLRNMAVGAGIGFGARRVGKAFGAEADDVATAGVGGNGSGNAGRFRFGPTGKAFNPYSTQVQDEIIRTSGGTVTERNIEDLMSIYIDDLMGSTPQQIVDDLRRQAGEIPMTPRDVEYASFAELMARHLKPMRGGGDEASPILTAGVGGPRKPRAPKMDKQARAIEESVRKIAEQINAKGIQPTPQQPEMRVGKGIAKLAGIKDNPAMSMRVAEDMLKAGRSPEEIWEATNRVPIKIEGRTILTRAPGKNPEDVQAAFWQEMAKPYSKRADWAKTGTEGIWPMGPNSVARKPVDDRLEVARKAIGRNSETVPIRDIWEETGIVVVLKDEAGQIVIPRKGAASVTGWEPVALMDGKQYKSLDEAFFELWQISAMPRAKQPEWYRNTFTEPLDTENLRKVSPREKMARDAGAEILKRPRVYGLTGGAILGGGAVVASKAEIDRRQKKNALAQ